MVSIAVISPNQDKRLAFATRLTDSLKGMRFPCRICSVKDPFASADKDPLEGFGILCLDAEDPDFARRALLGHREPPPR